MRRLIKNCPNCKSKLKRVKVKIEGAKSKATSIQCLKCGYSSIDFTKRVLKELRKNSL